MHVHGIVLRHPSSGAAEFLARNVSASVINAGDGMHEHPTQALLDMLSIRDNKGRIEGLDVVIVGDVAADRALSLALAHQRDERLEETLQVGVGA